MQGLRTAAAHVTNSLKNQIPASKFWACCTSDAAEDKAKKTIDHLNLTE